MTYNFESRQQLIKNQASLCRTQAMNLFGGCNMKRVMVSFYDLLDAEARLGCVAAINKPKLQPAKLCPLVSILSKFLAWTSE